jgi:hypothetical protein
MKFFLLVVEMPGYRHCATANLIEIVYPKADFSKTNLPQICSSASSFVPVVQ